MSTRPGRRVSLPCDQPTRYFDFGDVRESRVGEGKAAREEDESSTVERRVVNAGGRSETMRMPREDGTNADWRVEIGMLPGQCEQV